MPLPLPRLAHPHGLGAVPLSIIPRKYMSCVVVGYHEDTSLSLAKRPPPALPALRQCSPRLSFEHVPPPPRFGLSFGKLRDDRFLRRNTFPKEICLFASRRELFFCERQEFSGRFEFNLEHFETTGWIAADCRRLLVSCRVLSPTVGILSVACRCPVGVKPYEP